MLDPGEWSEVVARGGWTVGQREESSRGGWRAEQGRQMRERVGEERERQLRKMEEIKVEWKSH